MASGRDFETKPGQNNSDEISPSTIQAPRFESITHNDDDNDDDEVEPAASTPSFRTALDTSHEIQQTSAQDNSRQAPQSANSSVHQVLTPDLQCLTPKPKKPLKRSMSSAKLQTPYKGQEFSVDDDPSEYETDVAQRQSSITKVTATLGSNLIRKPSTLRRRTTTHSVLPRLDSQDENENNDGMASSLPVIEAEILQHNTGEDDAAPSDADVGDDDLDLSDAESFTLRDRQQAINETHPFGIRIWKPALYKKNRSVEKTAEGDIHSAPGGRVSRWLWIFNLLWTILFGWWLATAAAFGALACFIIGFAPESMIYGRVLWGLACYLFYPFGQFVKLEQDEAYADEDEGEGRSITEYEQWQSGDIEDGRLFFGPLRSHSLVGQRRASLDSADENDSLLGRTGGRDRSGRQDVKSKRRLFGRGQWSIGRVIFFMFFYFLVAPLLLVSSLTCWFLVFWIPMGKVTLLLFYHLQKHPLALSFHNDTSYSRGSSSSTSSVLLCTYRAVGLTYWKYTVDGTNIFLFNLIGVVLFVIFDYWVLNVILRLDSWLVNSGFIFSLALFSIIPLAYFIGQAVASISAQSSMGVGAAINAFFSTIVEVFLYCVALKEGKGQLVEGSVIGSIFAGILFLPGISMCFGAIKRKTQRFNVRSAGVTSTMLLFAVIAAFGPTLFYQIYGSHELNCHACIRPGTGGFDEDCRQCYFSQTIALHDRFFQKAVQPYCWFAAVLLFFAYIIGLWFTLRTHAAVIWNTEVEEKERKPPGPPLSAPNGSIPHHGDSINRSHIRESQLYRRIMGQSIKQASLNHSNNEPRHESASNNDLRPEIPQTPHIVPPKGNNGEVSTVPYHTLLEGSQLAGLSEEDNNKLARNITEMAATAATIAARDAAKAPLRTTLQANTIAHHIPQHDEHDDMAATEIAAHVEGGGHIAPNWSKTKSSVILLIATILYAVIAEILVNTVDIVLQSVQIDEKFLGITLFALVPNTTEFLNAISFAMNGNIALSMEIGSAYALQVCLLQLPALVLFSALHTRNIDPQDLLNHTFSLIFPQWDMVAVILCVFLLSYVYSEGKSNYFKGSILLLTYLVIIVGFYLAGYSSDIEVMGIDRFDTLAIGRESFKTIGRGRSGIAY